MTTFRRGLTRITIQFADGNATMDQQSATRLGYPIETFSESAGQVTRPEEEVRADLRDEGWVEDTQSASTSTP